MAHITLYRQVTVSNAAPGVGLGAIPAGTTYADIIPDGGVRYRSDGTAPTATVGMPLVANQPVTITGDQMSEVLFIRSGGSDTTINVEFGYSG